MVLLTLQCSLRSKLCKCVHGKTGLSELLTIAVPNVKAVEIPPAYSHTTLATVTHGRLVKVMPFILEVDLKIEREVWVILSKIKRKRE